MNADAKKIITTAFRAARALDPNLPPDILTLLSGKPDQRKDSLLLSQAETARLLSVSRFTVYNMEKAGQIKPVWIRGAKRFRVSDIHKLIGGAA